MSYLAAALLVALGVPAFLHGGADDSPGLQLIGAVLAVAAVVLAIRTRRRDRAHR